MSKKSKTACKPNKYPIGKNSRCVKLPKCKKTRICKAGKYPAGKNGRCVVPRTLKTRK